MKNVERKIEKLQHAYFSTPNTEQPNTEQPNTMNKSQLLPNITCLYNKNAEYIKKN